MGYIYAQYNHVPQVNYTHCIIFYNLFTLNKICTYRYDTRDAIIHFIDEVVQREVQEAGLGEGGEVQPGSLAAVAERTKRVVAHAMLLCANRRGINFFTKKRPDLIKA